MTASGTATATILFTDVVGSTELRAHLGEAAADRLFREHERRLATIVAAHHGRQIKSVGDGIMATFGAASDAVVAAMAVQQQVERTSPTIAVRIGIAAGDVSWEGGDCFGLPVVAAARLEAQAAGGQILVSEVVRWLAGDRAGTTYRPYGPVELKGLPEAVQVYEVPWEPLHAAAGMTAATTLTLPPALLLPIGSRLVGRAAEWAVLEEALERARTGGTSAVLVGGEAGAGKTRLTTEFARHCHEEGAVVLFGACDAELALPYQPWVQALDHLVHGVPPDALATTGVTMADLLVLLPQLAQLVPGLDAPVAQDPEADRLRLFVAVAQLLAVVGPEVPLVLVLDDLHWAGSPTLSLLRYIVKRTPAQRLLVLATFRDTGDEVTEPLAGCLADLRRVDGVTRMRLGGFDLPSIERFVADATGHELDADLRDLATTLDQRTAGNPFYVEELWHHLVTTGSVRRTGSRWVVEPGLSGRGVPDSVREVVRHRMSRLSLTAHHVIEVAAAAGPRVELRVLAAAAGLGPDELVAGLDELTTAGLLVSVDGVLPTYQFGHALVRDSVEASVAPLSRAQLHLKVGEAIERIYEADRRPMLAELARQFTAGAALSNGDKAVYYSRRAAAQAMRMVAHAEAIAHLDTALQLVAPGSPDQVELLLELGGAELRDGRYVESMRTNAEAFTRAVELGLVDQAAAAATGHEQAVHMPGLPGAPAVAMIEQAMELLGDGSGPVHTRLQASLARALSHAGRTDEALEQVEVAISMARRTGDDETLGAALEAALIATSDPDRLLELAHELTALANRSSDPWHELYATSNQLRAVIMLGRLDEAAVLLARHREVSEQGRYPAFQFVHHAYEVVLALAAGRLDDAEAAAERAHLLGAAGNTPFDAGVYGLQMFAIRKEQGRLAEVAPVLKLVASRQTDRAVWRPGLAALCAELDLLDEAERELAALAADDFASIPRDSVWPACLTFLAEVCVRLGDAERAAVLFEELTVFRGRNLMAGMTICFGPADRLLGDLAALLGRPDEAEEHLRVALALAERSRSPLWEAQVQYDWARLRLARGDVEGAVQLGRRAHQTAVVLGMGALAARPVPGLGATPARREPPGPSLPDGLSAREAQVLNLIAGGRSNREIGADLNISPNTAANHVRAILQKTGCANRAEAVAYAASHDLLR